MNLSYKKELQQHCLNLLMDKVHEIKTLLAEVQNAANNETKSTAGDKHETSRAMAHLEVEKLSKQLNEATKQQEILSKITLNNSPDKVTVGSFVKTNKGVFYISIGLGRLLYNEDVVFVISPLSPIGKLLINKKEKETFSLNNIKYIVEKIL